MPDEPDLMGDVRGALAEPHPHRLLCFVSSLLTVVDPTRTDLAGQGPGTPGPTLSDLAGTFIEVRCPETTALLTVLAEMVPDDLVARRVRRELGSRHDRLPDWLVRLAPVTVGRAVVMSHVLGDGDNVMISARTAAGQDLTVVVYIDHNLGTVVKDGFAIPEPVDRVVASFRSAAGADPDLDFADVDAADARARVTEAIELGAATFPPYETDTWPLTRPLVEWLARQLPEGGTGYERPEWGQGDRRRLARDFFASDHGRGLGPDDHDMFDELLWFGCENGPGDPLRWSPVAVEILLTDWLPRQVDSDAGLLGRAPELLRRFIRYSHVRRGVRPALTAETVAAVDRWEPTYRQAIGSPRPQGPEALLAAVGLLGDRFGDGDGALPGWLADVLPSYEEQVRTRLHETVGEASLAGLDARPLPNEPLDLSDVAEDIKAAVVRVAELVDAGCERLLDGEHRTACRRLLHDVAVADPGVFRRRARAETAAAAIVWIVVKAQGGFGQDPCALTVTALGKWFGVSNPGQRARTMLQALGQRGSGFHDLRLGTPRYLTADRRRAVIEMRDRYVREG